MNGLDSGKLIFDQSFYSQSQFLAEKSRLLHEKISAFIMVWDVGDCWCHITHLDHVNLVGGWQLEFPGLASIVKPDGPFILLIGTSPSLSNILAPFRLRLCRVSQVL